jgi:hypothetical protein
MLLFAVPLRWLTGQGACRTVLLHPHRLLDVKVSCALNVCLLAERVAHAIVQKAR